MTTSIVALYTDPTDTPDTANGERSFWRDRGAEYVEKLFAGVGRPAPPGPEE